ncbi:MAG: tol-pal system protein YbgF [Polyangiaceae bacterium]
MWPPFLHRSRSLALASIVVVAPALGCARSAEERHMAKLQEDLARVKSDHDRFDQRVSALEVQEAETRGPIGRPTNIEKSKVADTPRLKVVRIGPDGTEEQRGSSETAAVISSPEDHDDHGPLKTSAKDPDAKRSYDAALSLVNAKDYDQALDAFNGFLFRYPDHPRAENALYWRGECFFAKGEAARAAEQFEGLLARFPKGKKLPDALLRLGMAYEKLGQSERSESNFERLRRDFPRSEAARRMKSSTQKREVSP